LSRVRPFWIGLTAIPLCIAVAVAVTAAFGPLFGAWGWQATSFVLLIATSLVFLSLDNSSRSNDSPSKRIAPGMTDGIMSGDWDSVQFTQTFNEGADSLSRRPHLLTASAGWTRQALITGTAAFAFLIILLA
jgi:hypothetical protein